jgi:hypothetical protein
MKKFEENMKRMEELEKRVGKGKQEEVEELVEKVGDRVCSKIEEMIRNI